MGKGKINKNVVCVVGGGVFFLRLLSFCFLVAVGATYASLVQ